MRALLLKFEVGSNYNPSIIINIYMEVLKNLKFFRNYYSTVKEKKSEIDLERIKNLIPIYPRLKSIHKSLLQVVTKSIITLCA